MSQSYVVCDVFKRQFQDERFIIEGPIFVILPLFTILIISLRSKCTIFVTITFLISTIL